MYATRRRNPLHLIDFPGRIPFFHHLWGCIRIYLNIPTEDDWEVVDVDEDEWGHYDMELKKWVHL